MSPLFNTPDSDGYEKAQWTELRVSDKRDTENVQSGEYPGPDLKRTCLIYTYDIISGIIA